jgi:putative ABC transport system ATP-binding protein
MSAPEPAAVITREMVAVEGVTRTYGRGRTATNALRGVSFTVQPGQLVALRGRSGSGKTTLLNIVGGLDTPDAGRVQVAGRDVTAMSSHELMALRRTTVAFIFQSFGLIPILSAAENVGVPLRIAGAPPRQREERVKLMLDIVGLGEHARQRPGELSGGQQQRVAIARALAGSPQLLLADEPTGQLDSETSKQIMRLLRTVVQSEGVTALVATHDPNLIDIADSVLLLEDGKIQDHLCRTGSGACPAERGSAPGSGLVNNGTRRKRGPRRRALRRRHEADTRPEPDGGPRGRRHAGARAARLRLRVRRAGRARAQPAHQDPGTAPDPGRSQHAD